MLWRIQDHHAVEQHGWQQNARSIELPSLHDLATGPMEQQHQSKRNHQ